MKKFLKNDMHVINMMSKVGKAPRMHKREGPVLFALMAKMALTADIIWTLNKDAQPVISELTKRVNDSDQPNTLIEANACSFWAETGAKLQVHHLYATSVYLGLDWIGTLITCFSANGLLNSPLNHVALKPTYPGSKPSSMPAEGRLSVDMDQCQDISSADLCTLAWADGVQNCLKEIVNYFKVKRNWELSQIEKDESDGHSSDLSNLEEETKLTEEEKDAKEAEVEFGSLKDDDDDDKDDGFLNQIAILEAKVEGLKLKFTIPIEEDKLSEWTFEICGHEDSSVCFV